MNNLYAHYKKLKLWDPNKTLGQNADILDIQHPQAANLARKHKLKYKEEIHMPHSLPKYERWRK